MNVAQVIAALEHERASIDACLEALRPLMAQRAGDVIPAAARPGKSQAGPWKHRRRCQECKQLTKADPCQHCGARIAPSGARK